jgi:uncharacterized membrane protein
MEQPSRRLFPRWPSLAVLLGAAAYLTARWDSIPVRWISHWDARGQPNGWMTRSIPGVYGLLVMGAVIVAINEATAAIPARSGAPAASAIRAANVDCMRIISFGVAATMAVLAINLPLGPDMPLAARLAVGVGPLLIALVVGFTRLTTVIRAERASGRAESVKGYHGLYYADSDDRRLWVPKLNGMGWTINFGHPLGWPMLALVVILPILVIVLSAAAH